MIGTHLWSISAYDFPLQPTYPRFVSAIGYRHQLGVRISSLHRIEPDAQILLKPQMLKLDRYPRKADRLHRCHDGLRRPEILKVDSVSLREIFIIEPVRALLWTEIAHDETPAVSKNLKDGTKRTGLVVNVMKRELATDEIKTLGLKGQHRGIRLDPGNIPQFSAVLDAACRVIDRGQLARHRAQPSDLPQAGFRSRRQYPG